MKKSSPPALLQRFRLPFLGLAELIAIIACASAVFLTTQFYAGRIYPNVSIGDIKVGGLTIEEAKPVLEENLPEAPNSEIQVMVDDIVVATNAASLGLKYDADYAAQQAFMIGKSGSLPQRFLGLLQAAIQPTTIPPKLQFDPDLTKTFLAHLQFQVDIIGEIPNAELSRSNNPDFLEIFPGEPGRQLDVEETVKLLQEKALQKEFVVDAAVASTSATLTEEEIAAAYSRAEKYVGASIVFRSDQHPDRTQEISDQTLVSLLGFPDGYNEEVLAELLTDWSNTITREPQNAVFEYDPETLEVSEFAPARQGLQLLIEDTKQQIISSLEEIGAGSAVGTETPKESGEAGSDGANTPAPPQLFHELKLAETEPEVTLAETNDLGIVERIGYGDSEYDHSIPNRIHNVKITTDRISNTIIAPGEEFSFNQTLGEVSARTGYRSAYVIKGGRTELGDGGGVCQVSTTAFRAALNAGLPISKRLQHSYRVSYYELDSKPGIDATVYSGNIDLRFINDTGHHILLHGEADSENLEMYIEIYGTSDGRTAEIVDHEVWGATPALAPEYYDDPSLPAGTIRQIDWAAAGIKAQFTNVVRDASGEIIREEEYFSHYRPWAAKYLRGTG